MAINSMDTRIERKSRFKKKHIYSLIGIAVGLLCLLWLLFRDTSSSLKVEKERITIATVQKGEFNDYIRVIGQVLPDRIIYLDVIEGGRVEERLIEEGAQVRAGDVILRLSNPFLNIGILQSEADLAYQENELRNTHLSMEQEHLRLKQDRIGLSKELVQKERRFRQYERLYKKSLALVRGRLENLKVKAPVDGQLGNLEAQIGQSIAQGERIGQVITPELKVEAKIDEHYVERVIPGLPASFEREGKKYDMEVTKVYPEVREGQFRTDLHFVSGRPENIRAGQTYHLNLQLGDPVQAVIVPRGSFYQASGGEYMYVVDEEGKTARRRPVRIGRQNPQYYEVVEGLQPGEKVIISGYDLFGENERLILR